MNADNKRSLQSRIHVALLLIAVVTSLCAASVILLDNLVNAHQTQVKRISNLARIGETALSGSLLFNDAARAEQLLQRLRSDRTLEAIALYREDGSLLASALSSTALPLPQLSPKAGLSITKGHINLQHPVFLDGQSIGSLYLRNTSGLSWQQLQPRLLLSLVPLVIALSTLVPLSRRLKRQVITPLHEFSSSIRNLIINQDYNRHLPTNRDDELDEISESINELLANCQSNLQELKSQLSSTRRCLVREKSLGQAVYNTTPSCLLQINNRQNRVRSANQQFLELFGFAPTGLPLPEILKKIGLSPPMIKQLSSNAPVNHQLAECHQADLGGRLIELTKVNIESSHESLMIINDLTAHKKAETALFQEKERAQVTLETIHDAVITTDTEGRVCYMNPRAELFTGIKRVHAQGLPIERVLKLTDLITHQPAEHPSLCCLRQKITIPWQSRGLVLEGLEKKSIVEGSSAPLRNQHDKLIGIVNSFRDVTPLHKLTGEVSFHTSHDSLTGLLNRREFETQLLTLFDKVDKKLVEGVLLFINLDQFKVINENCGHIGGDKLLCEIAVLLQGMVRQSDNLARLERDDFAVLLEGCGQNQAIATAKALLDHIQNYDFYWNTRKYPLSASIGVVPLDEIDQDRFDIISLAESVCMTAKACGQSRYFVYQKDDVELHRQHNHARQVPEIHRAINDKRLELYCQPMKTVRTGRVGDHVEILLRMWNEQGKLLSPDTFLPAAEHFRLMPTIDIWVVEQTLTWLENHADKLPHLDVCAINLSGMSLNDDQFLSKLKYRLKTTKAPVEKLCFEITESIAVTNLSRTQRTINEFRSMGCRFSLDDFGTGMSSFAYLKHLPVNFLKIDGIFIRNIANSTIDYAMVKSIHDIGQVLGMETIAEYVESSAIEKRLLEIGIDHLQGFGIAKPQPLNNLLQPPELAPELQTGNVSLLIARKRERNHPEIRGQNRL